MSPVSTPKIFSPAVSNDADWTADLSFLASLKKEEEEIEHQAEGRLSVDVVQTNDNLFVVAPMAGTPAEKIELHLHNDLLTIRGERFSPASANSDYFHEECYWGKFSRSIVLPADIRAELAEAEYRHGVLLIKLPKARPQSEIPLMVVEE